MTVRMQRMSLHVPPYKQWGPIQCVTHDMYTCTHDMYLLPWCRLDWSNLLDSLHLPHHPALSYTRRARIAEAQSTCSAVHSEEYFAAKANPVSALSSTWRHVPPVLFSKGGGNYAAARYVCWMLVHMAGVHVRWDHQTSVLTLVILGLSQLHIQRQLPYYKALMPLSNTPFRQLHATGPGLITPDPQQHTHAYMYACTSNSAIMQVTPVGYEHMAALVDCS